MRLPRWQMNGTHKKKGRLISYPKTEAEHYKKVCQIRISNIIRVLRMSHSSLLRPGRIPFLISIQCSETFSLEAQLSPSLQVFHWLANTLLLQLSFNMGLLAFNIMLCLILCSGFIAASLLCSLWLWGVSQRGSSIVPLSFQGGRTHKPHWKVCMVIKNNHFRMTVKSVARRRLIITWFFHKCPLPKSSAPCASGHQEFSNLLSVIISLLKNNCTCPIAVGLISCSCSALVGLINFTSKSWAMVWIGGETLRWP